MPCCLVLGILFMSPRFILFGMWLLTDYLSNAAVPGFWGVVGFLFAPCTTMAYAIAQNEFGGLEGWGMITLVAGVVLDIFIYYGGRARRAARA